MDKKSIRILKNYFAARSNWQTGASAQIAAKDQAYLQAQGIRPDEALTITHDEAVARLRRAVAKVDRRRVADAFLVGFHPDRCVHRAGLRAFALGMDFPAHPLLEPHHRANPCPSCRTCGMGEEGTFELAYLEMLRHQYGACGDDREPFHAAYALEWFNRAEPPQPSDEDFERFNNLLRILQNAAAPTANALAKGLRPVVKGNKYTRQYVLETLGYCSILETTGHQGYLDGWIAWIERDLSSPPFFLRWQT